MHAGLQAFEGRQAGHERHDLTVEQRVAGLAGQRGQLRVGSGDLVAGPAADGHALLGDVDQGPHTVPFELECPARLRRQLRNGRCQHRVHAYHSGI